MFKCWIRRTTGRWLGCALASHVEKKWRISDVTRETYKTALHFHAIDVNGNSWGVLNVTILRRDSIWIDFQIFSTKPFQILHRIYVTTSRLLFWMFCLGEEEEGTQLFDFLLYFFSRKRMNGHVKRRQGNPPFHLRSRPRAFLSES